MNSSVPVIGINIGGGYCNVAVHHHGKIEIVANDRGNRCTPCCVAFAGDEIITGEAAKAQQHKNLENTLHHMMQFMGLQYDDLAAHNVDPSAHPFKIIKGTDDGSSSTQLDVTLGRAVYSVDFQGKATEYLPERVCSYLFKKLKIFAEGMAGSAVKFAVLTVPSGFTDTQREAIKAAGRMAGLQVLHVINEGAAAALTYDFDLPRHDGEGERIAIIVDVGSTACDVTVFQIEDGLLTSLANVRDETCGGSKLDANLEAHLADCFKRTTKASGIHDSHRAMSRLRAACETLKKSLSLNSSASVELDGLFEGLDLSQKVSRARFEGDNSLVFQKMVEAVKEAMGKAEVETDEVDDIVFVGGVAKTPKLRKMMEHAFGEELIRYSKAVNSDEVVAYGAAVQGSAMMESYFRNAPAVEVLQKKVDAEKPEAAQPPPPPQNDKNKSKKEQRRSSQKSAEPVVETKKAAGKKADVIPPFLQKIMDSLQITSTVDVEAVALNLGVKAKDGRMMPVLYRGHALPALHTVTCSIPEGENGAFFTVEVYEGQRLIAEDNRFVGCFTLPCKPDAKEEIEVTFCLDSSNILHAKAEGLDTGGAAIKFGLTPVEGQEVDTKESVQEIIDLADDMEEQDEEISEVHELKHNLLQRAKRLVAETKIDAVRAKAEECAAWVQSCFDRTEEFSTDEARSLNSQLDAIEGLSTGGSSKKSAELVDVGIDVDMD